MDIHSLVVHNKLVESNIAANGWTVGTFPTRISIIEFKCMFFELNRKNLKKTLR